jgi:hypothetical protein
MHGQPHIRFIFIRVWKIYCFQIWDRQRDLFDYPEIGVFEGNSGWLEDEDSTVPRDYCHPCMDQYGVESKMTGVFSCAVCFCRCAILTAAWSKWVKSRSPNTTEHSVDTRWRIDSLSMLRLVSSHLLAKACSNIFCTVSGMCCRIGVETVNSNG